MLRNYRAIPLALLCLFSSILSAAYLKDVPVELVQPNGRVLNCLSSGDEFYNWLHDEDGFTIIQSPTSGYYTYADKINGELIPTKLIPGKDNPRSHGLVPKLNIDEHAYLALRKQSEPSEQVRTERITGDMNNIVIYLKFSGDTEFNLLRSAEQEKYNSITSGVSSVRNFFQEASYNQLDVTSHFLPTQSGATIVSYQDIYSRNYYLPYNAVSNTIGYSDENVSIRLDGLLTRAVNHIQGMLPSGVNWDANSDGKIDNLVLFMRGGLGGDILYPTKSTAPDGLYLGSLQVHFYNRLPEGRGSVGVLCHEMGHTLGAPDLYTYFDTGIAPVGPWDIMAFTQEPIPQQFSAFTRWHYLGWISDIPTISLEQLYTLNPLDFASNRAYKILTSDPDQVYVLEYRRKAGTFESLIPESGLVIWRVNLALSALGNAYASSQYPVYVFREDGTYSLSGDVYAANFCTESGRTKINASTNPFCFLQDGTLGDLKIFDVGSAAETISFRLGSTFIDFSTNPSVEKFSTNTFPEDWANVAVSGTETFSRVSNGSNPNCQPFSAGGMAKYSSNSIPAGQSAYIASPKVIISQQSTAIHSLSFYLYRDNDFPSAADRIEVYRNSTANLNGSPVLLGIVHRSLSLAPAGSSLGWSKFSFNINPSANGSYYLILKAISGNGNNLYLDDIKLERHCQALLSSFSPANDASSVGINPTFSWVRSGSAPSGYRFNIGTNNPPNNIVNNQLIGEVSSFPCPITLAANTHYYWQVIPYDDLGEGFNPQVLGFTTGGLTPQSIPYSMDFDSVVVPQLPGGWGFNKASSNTGFWATATSALTTSGEKILVNELSDWVFTRGFTLNAGTTYQVGLQVRRLNQGGAGNLSIYLSNSYNPDDPKTLLITASSISDASSFRTVEKDFLAQDSGTFFILMQANNYLAIDDFRIVQVLSATVVNSNPTDNEVNVSVLPTLSWQVGSGSPTGFLINVGTNNPPSNFVYRQDVGGSNNWTPSTGLAYNTTYYWSVIPYSGSSEGINSEVWSFTTAGNAILPYAEFFDLLTPPALPQGWSVIDADGDARKWISSNQNAYSTPNCVRVRRNATQASNDWLITPPFKFFTGYNYRVSFRYRSHVSVASTYEKLQVSYGTSPDPANLTNLIYDNQTIGSNQYYIGTTDFTPTADGVYHLGFQSFGEANTNERWLYLDNIEVVGLNAPYPVTEVVPVINEASYPINSSLSWNHGGDVNGYKISLGTDNPPTNMLYNLNLGLVDSYTHPELWNFNTDYYWQIVPYNTLGDCPNNSIYHFTTMQAATITEFSYVEQFNSLTPPALPQGYFTLDANGDGITWESSGTTNKLLKVNSSPSDAAVDWLFLPGITMRNLSTYNINFSYRQGFNGKNVGMQVYLLSQPRPEAIIQEVFSDDYITFSSGHRVAQFSYQAMETGILYLGIKFYAMPNQGYLTVDDIWIHQSLIPVLSGSPTDGAMGVHNLPAFSWDAPEVEPVGYILYLGTDNPPTNTIDGLYLFGTTEYQILEPLDFGTDYYWQIVPFNYNSQALGCPVFSFQVMPAITITDLPYIENFDTSTIPYLPLEMSTEDVNADGATWVTSTTNSYSLPNCATLSGGNPPRNDWLYLPPLYLEAGLQYRISFMVRKTSVLYADYLGVFYGYEPNSVAMSTQISYLDQLTTAYQQYLLPFTPQSGGALYIGFRGTNEGRGGGIKLDDISVEMLSSPFYPPSNLTADPGNGVIAMNWQAPAVRGLSSYKIYRDGVLLGTSTADSTFFTDTNPSSVSTYLYFIKAVYQNPDGVSPASNYVLATLLQTPLYPYPLPAHSPIPADGSIDVTLTTNLAWTYTSDPDYTEPSGYLVKIGTDSTLTVFDEYITQGSPGEITFDLPGFLNFGSTYYWQAIPVIYLGNEPIEAPNCPIWNFSTVPAPTLPSPQNVQLTIFGEYLKLSWEEVPEAGEYIIFSSDDAYLPLVSWEQIHTTDSAMWLINPLEARKFYYVKANN